MFRCTVVGDLGQISRSELKEAFPIHVNTYCKPVQPEENYYVPNIGENLDLEK